MCQVLRNYIALFIFKKKNSCTSVCVCVLSRANQNIRMISEGSCNTEDWSNDAKNSALKSQEKLHFKIYSNRKQLF